MPVAILLSQCNGVFGCLWPIYSRNSQIIFVSFPFINNAPNAASAADATKHFVMLHTTKMFPSKSSGFPLVLITCCASFFLSSNFLDVSSGIVLFELFQIFLVLADMVNVGWF